MKSNIMNSIKMQFNIIKLNYILASWSVQISMCTDVDYVWDTDALVSVVMCKNRSKILDFKPVK